MAEPLRPGDPRAAGPYQLLARLGAGGMGQVFLGRSPGGRPVAVKVIRPELLAGQPSFRARFAREVASARRVSALYTAPVVDADPDAEMPWLVTAYVAGPSLADAVIGHGPMRAEAVRALGAALAEGLAQIHAAGVVHRDLKPANVLLAQDGPRIIDFGISRAVEASALTGTGLVVGSPGYMSPEQARGEEAGPPSDVFSLGSVLTFAATGAAPFRGGNLQALLFQVMTAEPELAGLPASLQGPVRRCLAKDPAQRPAPGEVLAELGPAGLSHDWLPPAVAAALPGYRPDALGATVFPGTGQAGPGYQPTAPAGPSPSYQPPPPPSYQPPPQPSYQPGRPRPPGQQPQPGAGRLAGAALSPADRFGWLAIPVLIFIATAAFTAPLETLYAMTWGFIVVVGASRLAALGLRLRRRGPGGLAGSVLRSVLGDVLGAAGLAALAIAMLAFTVDVLLPAAGPGRPGAYRSALATGGPADPFTSAAQAWFFLHVFLLPAAVAVTAVVVLRPRADLRRPLVLPRAVRLVNQRGRTARLTVAGILIAAALTLIGLNGGVAPGRRPQGAICAVAPATCAAAAKLASGQGAP